MRDVLLMIAFFMFGFVGLPVLMSGGVYLAISLNQASIVNRLPLPFMVLAGAATFAILLFGYLAWVKR